MNEDRWNGVVDSDREESRAPGLEDPPSKTEGYEPDIRCGFCPEEFNNMPDVYRHMESEHGQQLFA